MPPKSWSVVPRSGEAVNRYFEDFTKVDFDSKLPLPNWPPVYSAKELQLIAAHFYNYLKFMLKLEILGALDGPTNVAQN
jgi:hypothetical protein